MWKWMTMDLGTQVDQPIGKSLSYTTGVGWSVEEMDV